MLILFENASGFCLFKVQDEAKLKKVDNIWEEFQTVEKANKIVKLRKFKKFEDTADALSATIDFVDQKLNSGLKKFLKKNLKKKEELGVSDSKIGAVIKEKLGIKCVHNSGVDEVMRGIRGHIDGLTPGLSSSDLNAMSLGLSHSLSRYRLKFSPDKIDTMIVNAISLLDDLDKELNIYVMRVKEWYGWHFPELAKVLPDNILFVKAVKKMGFRENCATTDFSDIMTDDMEKDMKRVAEISMGTEVSQEDIENIIALCDQVTALVEYREQLYEYLTNRMKAIAPNLTILVGEIVGARLISHAGSLLNLAKQPASTIQILGAEKALFRALKTKHETPKYGLIYHASLVGQTNAKNKGTISRVLANKCAIATRVDAFGENNTNTIGVQTLQKVETRRRQLEGQQIKSISHTSKSSAKFEKYDASNGQTRDSKNYQTASDFVPTVKTEDMEVEEKEQPIKKEPKKEKKQKKESKKRKRSDDNDEEEDTKSKKKKKVEEKKPKKESKKENKKESKKKIKKEDTKEKKKKKTKN